MPEPAGVKSIHVVGDSISMHYGPYLAQYLGPAYAYSRKEGRVGNLDRPEGDNGGDSSMVLAYLRECAAARKYWDILAINCGLHDVKRHSGRLQISAGDYERNLVQILVKVVRRLADYVIWIRTTPVIDEIHNARMSDFQRFNADVEQYNAIADEVATAADWMIDLNGFCRVLGGAEIYVDHVHFTAEIQRLQGAFIAGHILAFMGGG